MELMWWANLKTYTYNDKIIKIIVVFAIIITIIIFTVHNNNKIII